MKSAAAGPETGPHRRILAIILALILYGSLYPWQFQARYYGRSPLSILLHTWPETINRYVLWDVGINVTLYVPLGIFAYLAVSDRAPAAMRLLLPLALAIALSASVEMLQLFDDSRTCSGADLLSNISGAALGMAAGALYRARLERLLHAEDAAVLLRPSGALLLLACWLGYELFPLFPVWGRTNLFHRLAVLVSSPFVAPADTLLIFAEWLAVACLLESLAASRTNLLLAPLLLLVPARLFLASRALMWPDIVGAVAAFIVWLVIPRRLVRRAAPVLIPIALILSELAPFHFAAVRPFSWIPFRGLFRSDWRYGFVILFRKSFEYGTVLWLWRSAGRSLAWTTAVAAASLFVLERIQVYLPGRTPETTDVALTILMGVLLWLLRDS